MPAINRNNLKQKNMGRVQASAVREEVTALLEQGYSRRALYDELRGTGAFTGSYRRFCEYFKHVRRPRMARSGKSPVPQGPEEAAKPQATSGFVFKNYSNEELK